jgi:Uma2 family endonuclease
MASAPTTTAAHPVSIVADATHLPMRARLAAPMSDEQLWRFCRANPALRVERTADGELVIMPPTGSETGRRNFVLTGQLAAWAEADGSGVGFDSSTGFILPNGAERSPDMAWIRRERWDALTPDQRERFAPLCPDFVVELRSPSDSLDGLLDKLSEYLTNGARLGWLIDPAARRVYVFRPDQAIEVLEDPPTVSGDPELPGFHLQTRAIF